MSSSRPLRLAILNCPGSFDYSLIFKEFFTTHRPSWNTTLTNLTTPSTSTPSTPSTPIEFKVYTCPNPTFYESFISDEVTYDAYLITGSEASAYDNDEWISKLCDVIRLIYAKKSKLIGICFGHQIISYALGGHVEKNPAGWGLGAKTFTLTPHAQTHLHHLSSILLPHNQAAQPKTNIHIYYCHLDHVPKLPEGFHSMGGAEAHAPILGSYNDHVITYQGHPEFAKAIIQQCVEGTFRDNPDRDAKERILNTLDTERDHDYVAATIVGFLLKGVMKDGS